MKTSYAQNLIDGIAFSLHLDLNPAGVEGHMRNQYGTLDHLDEGTFRYEVNLAWQCEHTKPGYLKACAECQGLEEDWKAWEGVAV